MGLTNSILRVWECGATQFAQEFQLIPNPRLFVREVRCNYTFSKYLEGKLARVLRFLPPAQVWRIEGRMSQDLCESLRSYATSKTKKYLWYVSIWRPAKSGVNELIMVLPNAILESFTSTLEEGLGDRGTEYEYSMTFREVEGPIL